MSYQGRGFRTSFIIHAVLLFAAMTLNNSIVRSGKPVLVDFSLENSSLKNGTEASSAPKSVKAKAREIEQPHPQPQTVAAQKEPVQQQAVPPHQTATSGTAAESRTPVSASRPAAGIQSSAGGISDRAGSAKTEGKASSGDGQGNSGDAMKQSYLREHFAYIRNIVQQKLSYPKIARKMGWEGKVTISFVVCIDGYARDITIREGSGIELLDKNAIAAVRNASPFPKPPVEAQLIIPIKYALD